MSGYISPFSRLDRVKAMVSMVVPIMVVIAMALLDITPLYLPKSDMLRPDLTLICIFFWGVFRPASLGSARKVARDLA